MSRAYDLLAELETCLCSAFEDEPDSPPLCFCGILPGAGVAADYIGTCTEGNGMAWVRLITSYPAVEVGQIDETPGNCAKGLGVDIEVGVLRRAPVYDSRGNPPTPQDQRDATLLQLRDMTIMHRAIVCCTALPNADFTLAGYTPMGPLGDTMGGNWALSAVI